VRRAAVLVAVVAGCFDPHAPFGVTCDPAAPVCPSGQTCVTATAGGAATCQPAGTPGGDGGVVAIDAPGDGGGPPPPDARTIDANANDLDGDGVPNATDNCPTTANADQHDEDGDGLGDVCDPCPMDIGTADADADGVAASCDPHPQDNGDSIFEFDGFEDAPTKATGWDVVGAWTTSADAVSISGLPIAAGLGYGDPNAGDETVMAQLTITATANENNKSVTAGAGVALELPGGGVAGGVGCFLVASAQGNELELVDIASQSAITGAGLKWSLNEKLQLVLERTGTSYTCTCPTIGGATVTGTDAASANTPEAGPVVGNANASYDWILVVHSP
jgi:hypothetical protein